MPIPPRPIPTQQRHRHHHHRPGVAVPRKSLTTPSSLEWRSELALLDGGSRSVPLASRMGKVAGGGGLNMVDKAQLEIGHGKEREDKWKTQISLEGLIEDGKVERKRKDTALGFEKVPGPTILALPDGTSSFPLSSKSKYRPAPASSLLSSTKDRVPAAGAVPSPREDGASWPALALSGTPTTPGLLARGSPSSEEEDEDDDWEHIPSLTAAGAGDQGEAGVDEDEDEDSGGKDEEEEDVIVLGELELEDELDRLDIEERVDRYREGSKTKGKSVGGRRQQAREMASYAAAAGGA